MPIQKNDRAIIDIIQNGVFFTKVYKGVDLVWQKFVTVLKGFSGHPATVTKGVGEHLTDYNVHGNTKQFRIPQDYVELEFISTTGTQYIDTGLTKARFVHDIAFTNGEHSYMGSGVTNAMYWGSGEGGNFYTIGRKSITASTSVRRVVEYNNLNNPENTLSVNGFTISGWGVSEIPATYSLFRITNTNYYASAVLYSFQAYDENNNFLANYIPAKRKSDDKVGFYDTVSGEFKTNQGSGEFFGIYEAIPTPSNPFPIYSVGDETYDNSEITSEGNVQVSSDGIASSFSELNYVRTTLFDARRPFEITYGDLSFYNIAGRISFGSIVDSVNNTSLTFILDGYERRISISDGVNELALPVAQYISAGDDFTVKIVYNVSKYRIEAYKDGSLIASREITALMLTGFPPAQVAYVRIGSSENYPAYSSSMDLLEFCLKSNGEYIAKPKKYLIPIVYYNDDEEITVNIAVNEQLRKVGGVYDTLDFKDQVVVRRIIEIEKYSNEDVEGQFVSTTSALSPGAQVIYIAPQVTREPIFLPAIPTFEGTTNFKVDTFIEPSLLYVEAEVQDD